MFEPIKIKQNKKQNLKQDSKDLIKAGIGAAIAIKVTRELLK